MERRWILFILISFLIIQAYTILTVKNQPKPQPGTAAGSTTGTVAMASTTATQATATATPAVPAEAAAVAPAPAATTTVQTIENTSITIAQHPGELKTIETDKYLVKFDSVGAVIHSWQLLDLGSHSLEEALTTETIELVRRIPLMNRLHFDKNQSDPEEYVRKQIREFSQTTETAPQTWPLEISFSEANLRRYDEFNVINWDAKVSDQDDATDVAVLTSPEVRGISVKKSFTFPKDKYTSTFRVTVSNNTDTTVPIYDEENRGLVLRWGPGLVERPYAAEGDEEAYDRAVYRADGEVEQAVPAADKDPITGEGFLEWAGVESKFLTALIIPDQPDDAARKQRYYFRALVPGAHDIGRKEFAAPLTMELATGKFDLGAHSSRSFDFELYVGPKKYRTLKSYGHQLQTLMFHDSFAFMRWIYLGLTDLLNWLYTILKNYGYAIIALTIIVRLVTFPLTQHTIRIQLKTMSEQQKVKPYIDQINEKYKDNPQEKSRQIWKVYQEHGISPFSAMRGCVPMILQMPVFIGLYRVSNDTIDLKGATFMWINDLSQPDHLFHFGLNLPFNIGAWFNLLPILMAATQMATTYVASARMQMQDPTQKQMMYLMPFMFMFFLYQMPAGLMVYWIASNIWQIGQTVITNRIMERHEREKIESGVAVPFTPKPVVTPSNKKSPGSKKKK